MDGCDLVDFRDERYFTHDDDRDGLLEARTITDENAEESPTDRERFPRVGRGERVG